MSLFSYAITYLPSTHLSCMDLHSYEANQANVMSSMSHGCDVTQIVVKMLRSSIKLIEMTSNCKMFFSNASKTSKLVEEYISHNSVIDRQSRRVVGTSARILVLKDYDNAQMTFVHKIDRIVSVKTSKSIKRDCLRSIWKSLYECRAIESDNVHFK